MKEEIFDFIIIGGGPAGVTAGVYAARKKMKTLLLTLDFGGQSTASYSIENWIGELSIKGSELAKKLENHLRSFEGPDFVIKDKQIVKKVKKKEELFKVTTQKGETFFSKSLLISSGAKRRKLDVLGAKEFEHKGLTYCATCDGPLFAGKDVAVVGGGNSGFESASQLAQYAKSVVILQKGPKFKADEKTIEKVLSLPNVEALTNVKIQEIQGQNFVEKILFEQNGEKKELFVSGIFVEIGTVPETEIVDESLVDKNSYGQIIIDHKRSQTKTPGLYAAGDCTDSLYKQNTIAMGQATIAVEDAFVFLNSK